MHLKHNIDPVENRFVVTIDLQKLTGAETDAVNSYGEFIADVGGDFTGSVSFSLDTRELSFPSSFPVVQTFDQDDETVEGRAAVKAGIWKTTVLARLVAALTALRDDNSGDESEEITSYDTTP